MDEEGNVDVVYRGQQQFALMMRDAQPSARGCG
jgi:hypothetical protein